MLKESYLKGTARKVLKVYENIASSKRKSGKLKDYNLLRDFTLSRPFTLLSYCIRRFLPVQVLPAKHIAKLNVVL